jgi:hypothetical protein
MNILVKKIIDHNNLYWAWEKAKSFYKPGDIWFNEIEVAAFESNLANELSSIREDIKNNSYKLAFIKPVAYPKGRNDEGPRTRQTFWVSVRDQVVWLAVVNIIGRYLDSKMPFWSYGNRLYITMFYDDILRFGYYRNTTQYTYRKWSQSWPLYRRHINITTKYLTKENAFIDDLDPNEKKVIDVNDQLSNHPLKSEYLDFTYWKNKKSDKLYWAGLDLEKFYPSINNEIIVQNVSAYLPEKLHSQDLQNLIKNLLDFKLDLDGWNEDELKTINLSSDVLLYPHLPTGLFAAGFLANVALLHVDKEVDSELKNNRNIAHFRYVDDHVILATSFEELVNWINKYEKIISRSNIGTKFNPSKTEPASLAQYFNTLEGEDAEQIKKHEADAKRQCSLNPDFPSPLMTKTLSKVSKIAGTTFNLLSPDEEKNLIADVEHLLVTEFPDHELRKDTRVSFAARMLTSVVPQMSIDSTEEYRLHKNICLKELKISETKKSKLENEEKESLIEVLTIEKNDYVILLKTEKDRLKNEEKRIANHTIKLLLKAVQDNHDKVRLWGRLVEFFLRSGEGSPKVLFAEISKLKERDEVNDLSLTFLNALLMQVLANVLFGAIRVLDSENSSYKRKQRAKCFLINFYTTDVFSHYNSAYNEKLKFYELVSLQQFMYACIKIKDIANSNYLDDNEKINIEINNKIIEEIEDQKRHSKDDLGVWAWWLFNKLPQRKLSEKPYLWDEIVTKLNLKKFTDINVLLLYPDHIPLKLLRKIEKNSDFDVDANQAVLFDIYKAVALKDAKKLPVFSKIIRKDIKLTRSFTLFEWIKWTNKESHLSKIDENGILSFDPRLSEWTALEIVKQVAEDVKTKLESLEATLRGGDNEYHTLIHPHNFKVPKKWFEIEGNLTWELLSNMMNSRERIEMRSKENLIIENRFIPIFENGIDSNQAMFYALGNLLVSLLSKETYLPNKWNPLGFQQGWTGLANLKLRNVAVSTYTRSIISSCFSKKNIETQFNLRLPKLEFEFDDDTNYDPPELKIIDDFIDLVKKASLKLKHQQLLVSSQQPRQLTPISLIQLKRADYLEESAIENIE